VKSTVSKILEAESALGTPLVNSSVPIRVSIVSGAERDCTTSWDTCCAGGEPTMSMPMVTANARACFIPTSSELADT